MMTTAVFLCDAASVRDPQRERRAALEREVARLKVHTGAAAATPRCASSSSRRRRCGPSTKAAGRHDRCQHPSKLPASCFLPVLRPAVHAATSLGTVLLALLPGRRSPRTPFCNGSSATRRPRPCAESAAGHVGRPPAAGCRRWRGSCNAKQPCGGHCPRHALARDVAHQVCGRPPQRHDQPHPRQGLLERPTSAHLLQNVSPARRSA
jgi:hypothetical protein